MPDGLKKELGLGEPKSPEAPAQGSTEQADKFKAAFQAKLQKVNGNLQYTAVHAEQTKHDPEAGKRDKTCSAYQVALGKIDPTNPSAAQGAIDQVLKAVDGLGSAAESFKQNVEKAFTAWTEKQSDFDALQDKVREMAEWGHEKAGALQKVVEGVAEKANAKKYEESCTVFDGLSGKAQPIIEDYTQERKAEEEYEGKLPEVETQLREASEPCDNDKAELQEKQKKVQELVAKMKEAAASKGFVAALGMLGELGGLVAEYLKELGEIAAKKVAYETAAKAEEANFTAADTVDDAKHYELEKAKKAYEAGKQELDALVTAEDWDCALAKLPEVAGLAKTLVELRKKYDEYQSEYAKVKDDLNYVKGLMRNCPPDPAWNAELTECMTMVNNFNTGKFDAAIAGIKSLQPKVADLKKRVEKKDKENEPKAEAANEEIKKLAGGKDVDKLTKAERDKLVEDLKKLKPEKQRELLTAMHAPSGPLTTEQRHMQAAMYKAMNIDEEFKKADQKIRDKYQAELQKDKELQKAIVDWNATGPDGKPLVDDKTKKAMLKKIVSVQSKAYGIDEPEIAYFNEGPKNGFITNGAFDAQTTRITMNERNLNKPPSKMINAVIHENTHNYQDELVKQYIAGKIKKDDPRYEQAKTFASFHHWDAYETGKVLPNVHPDNEGHKVYKAQPEEMHAFEAGDSESLKLITAAKNPLPSK